MINSADKLHLGTHDVTIWAEVDNTNPQIRSDTMPTPVTLDFQVLMVNSYCINGVINPPTLTDMTFEMILPYNPTTQVMPEWTHSITMPPEDCSARIYTLSGTAFDQGILTLDDATRTLSVWTPNAFDIGTFTATTVTTDIGDRPFLIPLLQVSASFSITITSPCETTTLLPNIYIIDKMNYVGDEPVIWRYEDWQDTVSNSVM